MRAWALLGVLAAGAGCATVETRPEGPEVDSLKLYGTRHLGAGEVKKKILTSESSFWPGWMPLLGDTQYFDANAWQADLRRIERFYQAEGYYQAKVLEDHVAESKPGHVRITATVKEGPPTKIISLAVLGLEGLPTEQRARVGEKLPMKEGELFIEDDWTNAKALLFSRLKELGYAEALVEGEAVVDLEKNTAALTLTARPGPRYRFGNIFVATDPDAKVTAKRIAEQVEGAVHPGDWYSESALSEAQGLVFQMGVFGAVKVNRGAPDRAQGTVPVVVDVREAPFHTVRFGPGIGVDSVRQEARLLGEYTNRHFFGGLRRFTVQGKLGWAFLPTLWGVAGRDPSAKSGPIARVLTEFEQPRLLYRTLSGQLSLELSSNQEPGYAYYGGTAKIGVVWRPTTTLTVFPSYNLDIYRLTSGVPLGTAAPEALFGCPLTCVVSYLEQTVEWDRRDNKLEPKTGTYLALSLQEGGGPLGGVFTYLRVTPEARGYLSFGEEQRVTFGAKLKVGTLISRSAEESPILARFFSGGSAMRGFSTRRLSPLLATARPGEPAPELDPSPARIVPGETLPIGGKGLVEAQLELRWAVWGDLVLSVFNDSGLVTWESLDLGNFSGMLQYLYTAVGFGVRYRTPLGPVRVDLAFRLPVGKPQRIFQSDPRYLDYPRNAGCFGLGNVPSTYAGYPEGVCSFHLSIGEAF